MSPYHGLMAQKLTDYIEAGKALDQDEREIAALALQHVDESEQAEIDVAWTTEINRRADEIINGEAELVDGEETLASIHDMIAVRRTT